MSSDDVKIDASKIDCVDMLERLDIVNIRDTGAREIRFSCPFPNHPFGDRDPSAAINRETTSWQCFACNEHGSTAVSLVAGILKIDFQLAARFLREKYGGVIEDPDAFSLAAEIKRMRRHADEPIRNETIDESVLKQFPPRQRVIDYMLGRGFTRADIHKWQIGFDDWHERLAIPVRDEHSRLVGFKSRSLSDEKPKYMILGGSRYPFGTYHKSLICFGLDRAKQYIGNGTLILVEGELNVIALHRHGFPNCAAINGAQVSDEQFDLIRHYAAQVLIFFDADAAGEHGAIEIADKLAPYMPVFCAPPHEGDPASMSFEDICDCISDATSFTCEKLLDSLSAS